MDKQQHIDALNERAPGFIAMLGGSVIDIDQEDQTCTFAFHVTEDFCHSVDIVQGGFITAMLDAAMSHALFSTLGADELLAVSSLEIKTSYLEVTRAGPLIAVGRIIKAAYKTAFLEGYLYNDDGQLTATASSVAKLVRPK